jgi:hypothetical protein
MVVVDENYEEQMIRLINAIRQTDFKEKKIVTSIIDLETGKTYRVEITRNEQ